MSNLYNGLDKEGLKLLVEELNKQAGRAETYNVLSKTQEGKLLIADMRKRLEFIRKQYQYVDPTSPSATHLLAMMQANEREITEWLNRLVSYRDFPKEVGLRIAEIKKLIAVKNIKPRNDMQLVPDEVLNNDK